MTTLRDIDAELYYELLSLSFNPFWEGYPWVFMGDVHFSTRYL